MTWVVLGAVTLLAYTNGANDNFKPVATIYGSGTASYRTALAWATLTQLAGSLLATVLASGLIATFSAKGLVPADLAVTPAFLGAVAIGGMSTVLIATLVGLPISTTHALTGALVGAGFISGRDLDLSVLGKSFFLPLGVSPVVAILATLILYPLARWSRRRLGIERESCLCIGTEWIPTASLVRGAGADTAQPRATLGVSVGSTERCVDRYRGAVVGISAQRGLDLVHFVSAGAIGFARGLNDTPKIMALALGAAAVGAPIGVLLIGGAMAVGGLLNARKVAETMAHKITTLNAGQGCIANLTSAVLIIGASRFGLPVSTTHVSSSALFGIGVINRTARGKVIAGILAAWVSTLPVGAVLGGLAYVALTR